MDRKDEIIKLQMDVINQMTRNNLNRIADDLWGAPSLIPFTQPEMEGITSLEDFDDMLVPDGASNGIKASEPSLDNLAPDIPSVTSTPIPPSAPINPATPAKTVAPAKPAEQAKAEEPPEDIEALKKELNEYIGLQTVKKEVESLINLVTVQELRKKNGLPADDLSLHMVFSGNPGTGKTMIARLMARVYKSLGILSKGQLVEVDRGGLVAGFVGQTAIKTSEVVAKALGGVLFIDEAYALTNHEGNDYGQEAVDTLLKAMEDHRDDLVVIVAGYIELMEDFIHSNPGLESRFNRFLNFPDYTVGEMLDIFDMRCKKSGYVLDDDARDLLKSLLALYSLDAKGFGNARGVRNLLERAVSAQANRLAKLDGEITRDTLMLLTADDIRTAGGASEDTDIDALAREHAGDAIAAVKPQDKPDESAMPAEANTPQEAATDGTGKA